MCSTQWRSPFIQLNETYPTVRKLHSGVPRPRETQRTKWQQSLGLSERKATSYRAPLLISKRDQCVTILCSLEYTRITVRTRRQFFRNLSNGNIIRLRDTIRISPQDGEMEFNKLPRDIVAKFTFFKDWKFIRTPAALKPVRVTIMGEWTVPTQNRRKKKKNCTLSWDNLRKTINEQN